MVSSGKGAEGDRNLHLRDDVAALRFPCGIVMTVIAINKESREADVAGFNKLLMLHHDFNRLPECSVVHGHSQEGPNSRGIRPIHAVGTVPVSWPDWLGSNR